MELESKTSYVVDVDCEIWIGNQRRVMLLMLIMKCGVGFRNDL